MVRLVAWTLGCLWGHEMPPEPLVGSLGAVALWRMTRGRFRPWRPGLVAGLLGALWAGWWSPPGAAIGSPEGVAQVQGQVTRTRDGSLFLALPLLDGRRVPGALRLEVPQEGCEAVTPGARIWVDATVRGEPWDANPGASPAWAEPGWSWFGRALTCPSITHRGDEVTSWVYGRARLPGEEVTGLYRALLLGDRRDISPWIRDAFGDTGTAHLLAISGLHMAVVGWGVYRVILLSLLWLTPLAHRVRVPALASLLSILWVWGYVGLIAPSEATLRAAIVLTSVMLSGCLGRWGSPGHTLMVAAAGVLTLDPGAIRGPSFQLSFAAATSLVLLAPWLHRLRVRLLDPQRPEEPWALKIGQWLTQSALVSVTTACATAPLCLAWFGQVAPIGVVVNLVAVPLVALVVVPSGMVWLLVQSVSPALGELLAPAPTWAGGLLLDLVEGWAEVVGPSTTTMWPHPVAITATAVFLCVLYRPQRWRWWTGASFCTLVWLGWALSRPPGLSVEMLDVGHGDAVLLQLPGGANVLVDAGGSRAGGRGDHWVARRRVLPALQRRGISQLDLLVITHRDNDHLGGAVHLARRLPVTEVWLPLCDQDHPRVRALAMAVRGAGGAVATPRAGAPLRWSGATIRVLWPDPRDPEACDRGPNNGSVAMRISYAGRRVLLTGDLERPAEMALVKRWGEGLSADVLKVAHHGSRTSSTALFLKAVKPRIALISGPMGPRGRHPHPEVVGRLSQVDARVAVTGRDGAVRVSISETGELRVQTRR